MGIWAKTIRKAMNHPSRDRFRRSVFIGELRCGKFFERKGGGIQKAYWREIVTEHGTMASKSGLESVGRQGWDGAWKAGCEQDRNPCLRETGFPVVTFRIAKTALPRQRKYMAHTNFSLRGASRHCDGGPV